MRFATKNVLTLEAEPIANNSTNEGRQEKPPSGNHRFR
jgi:hypothetical protein